DRAATHVSYFRGSDPERWAKEVSTFETVSLGEVWPGILLDVRARGRTVEKLFTVKPGADPSRIRISVDGARSLTVDGSGARVVGPGLGDVMFTPPAAFQERRGARVPVTVAYTVAGRQYGFRLDGYDPSLPLVIDPLLQATYLGGSDVDFPFAVAIHPTSGDVYITGRTASTVFPGTAGGAQPSYGGGVQQDAWVARLSADLTTLAQAT